MRAIDLGPGDQIFTHTDETGVVRHFNTTALLKAVFERKVKPNLAHCDLYESFVEHIRKNHGVEEDRLGTLTDAELEEPVMLAEFKDGTSLLIDGNHRVVRRWEKGLKRVNAMVFTQEQWEPYLVHGFDQVYSLNEVVNLLGSTTRPKK